MLASVASEILILIAKQGVQYLTPENISKAVKAVKKFGKKFSPETEENLMKLTDSADPANGDEAQTAKITQEAAAELTAALKDIVKMEAKPVYASGVIFICEQELLDGQQEELRRILTNVNAENDDKFGWEDEEDKKYQQMVDIFMTEYLNGNVNPDEQDYIIDGNLIIINFNIDGTDRFRLPYYLCDETEIRELADSLNYLLGDKHIISFSVF